MAQAEQYLTTRRGFSKWLAAAVGTVATGGAVAVAMDPPGIDWTALGKEFAEVLTPFMAADAALRRGHAARDQWELDNPFPKAELGREAEIIWQRAYEANGRKIKIGALKQRRDETYDRAFEVAKKIADAPVKTLDDLRAKALLASREYETGPIHRALFKQLLKI